MMDDLIEWFNEADGFSQGTKAPHKWVLQAEQEIRMLRARLAEAEMERDAERAFFGTREAALADARRDAMLEAAEVCDRNATAIRDAIGENPLIKKRMVLLKRAEQSDADAATIRALATQEDKG